MSWYLVEQVRERRFATRTQKAVAAGLAFFGHDDGTEIRPAVATVAEEAQLSERHCRRIIEQLCKMGLLVRVRESRQHSPAHYELQLEVLWSLPMTDAAMRRHERKERYEVSQGEASAGLQGGHSRQSDRTSATVRVDICDTQGGHPRHHIKKKDQGICQKKGHENHNAPVDDASIDGDGQLFDLTPPTPPPAKPDPAEAFEQFWQAYPRKVAKGRARKAWAKAATKAHPETIIEGAARYAVEQHGRDPEFTKHPATWLAGECWLDEPAPRHAAGQRQGPPSALRAFARAAGIDPEQVDRSAGG